MSEQMSERERLAVLVDAAAFDCDAWPATVDDEARRMEAVSAAFEKADAILADGFGRAVQPRACPACDGEGSLLVSFSYATVETGCEDCNATGVAR